MDSVMSLAGSRGTYALAQSLNSRPPGSTVKGLQPEKYGRDYFLSEQAAAQLDLEEREEDAKVR